MMMQATPGLLIEMDQVMLKDDKDLGKSYTFNQKEKAHLEED